jgi:hypothetical protein
MEPIFEAVRYVGTPLTLVAFVVATVAYVLRARLAEQRKMVEAASSESRVEMVDRLFRDFGQVPTADLTRDQRYRLALRLIGERQARFRAMLIGSLGAAVLLAAVVIFYRSPPGLTTMTVQVHGPAGLGNAVAHGQVTVSQGPQTSTRETAGPGTPLVFPLSARPSESDPVRIVCVADGFRPWSRTVTSLPPDGVVDVGLETDDAERELRGTVKDIGTNQALAGVTLDFESGQARAVTDDLGDFKARLRARSGAKLSVVARRGKAIGFNGFVTLSEQPLTVYFQAGQLGQ